MFETPFLKQEQIFFSLPRTQLVRKMTRGKYFETVLVVATHFFGLTL